MTPEDFSYFQSRVTRFISGSSSGIKFGSSVTPRYTRLSSIIPRRAVPKQVLEKIQGGTGSDDNIDTSTRGVSALGRVTLNLEQTKNNLEKIFQIIADDYKSTREQNRKEIDDYRKRVANRGRIFGKRELGDKKSDILGTIRKYVGSFFSGTGGAIRALAMFNLLQGLLSGDPSKIIGPLLGIGLTYIPSIIGNVIGGVVGGVGTALAGRMFGGGARAAGAAAESGAGASKLGKLGKFGGKAALIGGGLALASGMFNKPQEEDQQQQRLQQLTEQQKGSVGPQSLVPIPQDQLKRFDSLNKKFEAALDFLLKKQKEGRSGQGGQGQSGGGAPPPAPTGDFTGSGGSQKTMNYLMSQGLTKEQSAGIAGNLMQESHFDPMADNNPGSATEGHFGIAQWDKKIRWPRVKNYIESVGMDPYSLEGQLVGLKWEAEKRGDWEKVKKELTPDAAARSWLKNFERSGEEPGMKGYDARISNAINLASGSQVASGPALKTTPPSRRNVSPLAATPNVTVLPVPVSSGQQQQTSAASPGSTMVPPIDTTYPENFLALYSKLIYQIV